MKTFSKNIKKNTKNLTKNLNDGHSNSDCYSITIRTGDGVILGSTLHLAIVDWFHDSDYREYIISIEKNTHRNDATEAHFQCGILLTQPQRQDNIRRSILNVLEKCINLTNDQRKYAVKVKPHKDWSILVNYCLKEVYRPDWAYHPSVIFDYKEHAEHLDKVYRKIDLHRILKYQKRIYYCSCLRSLYLNTDFSMPEPHEFICTCVK